MKTVIVLGAGLQGTCVALALQKAKYKVILVDKMQDCMQRASLRNEGKIHLGFVYANDSSFKTAELMLRSALNFSPLIEQWVHQPICWQSLKSRAFIYGIAKDSMVASTDLQKHYEKMQNTYAQMLQTSDHYAYLGSRPEKLWQSISKSSYAERFRSIRYGKDEFLEDFVQTEEMALDLPAFHSILRTQLNGLSEDISTHYQHTIDAVKRTAAGFKVEGHRTTDNSKWEASGDIVVNCLWEGRMQIDATLDIQPPRPWVFRLKYRMLGQLPENLHELPSMTFVLGPYGDIVTYPSRRFYLSWYPTAMRGWSKQLVPPDVWEAACNGKVSKTQQSDIIQASFAAMENIVPGIRAAHIDSVDAGIIFSWGKTDIDDINSSLHQRHEIGVQAHDGYFSIDTGKYTSAPLFTQDLINLLA